MFQYKKEMSSSLIGHVSRNTASNVLTELQGAMNRSSVLDASHSAGSYSQSEQGGRRRNVLSCYPMWLGLGYFLSTEKAYFNISFY